MFEINGNEYDECDLMDSIVDGVCQDSECGETSSGHESDATSNYCPHCGKNSVISVVELLLFS